MNARCLFITLLVIGLASLQPGSTLKCYQCTGEQCSKLEDHLVTCPTDPSPVPGNVTESTTASTSSTQPTSGSSTGGSSQPTSGSSTSGSSQPTSGSSTGGSTESTSGSSTSGSSQPTSGSSTGGSTESTSGSSTGGSTESTSGSSTSGSSQPTSGSSTGGSTESTSGSSTSGSSQPTSGSSTGGSTESTSGSSTGGSTESTSGSSTSGSSQPTSGSSKDENLNLGGGHDRRRRSLVGRFLPIQLSDKNATKVYCFQDTNEDGSGDRKLGCTTEESYCGNRTGCKICDTDACNSATSNVVFTSMVISFVVIALFAK